jgi:hypothetical protein
VKALWLLRPYDDVVNSMLVSFRNQAAQVKRVARDPTSDGCRGRGMSTETLALVRKLSHPGIDDARAAALQWYFRNILFFEQGLDSDARARVVPCNRLTGNAAGECDSAFGFLGLPYSARFAKGIHARSVGRRAPRDISAPVRIVCDELMSRFEEIFPVLDGDM